MQLYILTSLDSKGGWFALILFALTANTLLAQPVIYVSQGKNRSQQNGRSWATAYDETQLQRAIDEAASLVNTGAQVWVATGIYKPTSTTARNVSFVLGPKGRTNQVPGVRVRLYGGFMGDETTLSQRPLISLSQPPSTTLSGDIGQVGDTSDNSYHVVVLSIINDENSIDGFVIRGGQANGGGYDYLSAIAYNSGGGMYAKGGGSAILINPTIVNCSFIDNYASNAGGALVNDCPGGGNSSPILLNCNFRNNKASYGGALANLGSIHGATTSPRLINCKFIENTATVQGGAMYNYAYYDKFSGNISNPVLINCIFEDNHADEGGALYNIGVLGGICKPRLVNCSFVSNTAANGGAMYNYGTSNSCQPNLINCSLSGNTGAFFNYADDGECIPRLTNCILWNNGGSQTIKLNGLSPIDATYCLFDSLTSGFTPSPTNLTTTTSPFISDTNLQLKVSSIAVNAGNDQTYFDAKRSGIALDTDLAGNPRFALSGSIDLGAYEFKQLPPTNPCPRCIPFLITQVR